MGTKLISKYQPGGRTKKDDKKGNKKEQPAQQEQEVIQGNAIPSWYRPPIIDADPMGGLGAGVANLQRMRNEQIAREEAARREQAQYQAYLRQAGLTPYQMSYDKWILSGKPTSVPRPKQAYLSQDTDTRSYALREKDKKREEFNLKALEAWYNNNIRVDPTGTAHTTAAVLMAPYAWDAAKNYVRNWVNDPLGALANEGEGLARLAGGASQMLLSMPAAPVTEAQGLRTAMDEGNGWDMAEHALMLGVSASPWLFNGVPAPSRVPAPSTAPVRSRVSVSFRSPIRVEPSYSPVPVAVGTNGGYYGFPMNGGFRTMNSVTILSPIKINRTPKPASTPSTPTEPPKPNRTLARVKDKRIGGDEVHYGIEDAETSPATINGSPLTKGSTVSERTVDQFARIRYEDGSVAYVPKNQITPGVEGTPAKPMTVINEEGGIDPGTIVERIITDDGSGSVEAELSGGRKVLLSKNNITEATPEVQATPATHHGKKIISNSDYSGKVYDVKNPDGSVTSFYEDGYSDYVSPGGLRFTPAEKGVKRVYPGEEVPEGVKVKRVYYDDGYSEPLPERMYRHGLRVDEFGNKLGTVGRHPWRWGLLGVSSPFIGWGIYNGFTGKGAFNDNKPAQKVGEFFVGTEERDQRLRVQDSIQNAEQKRKLDSINFNNSFNETMDSLEAELQIKAQAALQQKLK